MSGQAKSAGSKAKGDSSAISHVTPKLSGKVFFRASSGKGRTYVSGQATEAVVPSVFAENVKRRCLPVAALERELLEQLFLPDDGEGYTAILPAEDHPESRMRRAFARYPRQNLH